MTIRNTRWSRQRGTISGSTSTVLCRLITSRIIYPLLRGRILWPHGAKPQYHDMIIQRCILTGFAPIGHDRTRPPTPITLRPIHQCPKHTPSPALLLLLLRHPGLRFIAPSPSTRRHSLYGTRLGRALEGRASSPLIPFRSVLVEDQQSGTVGEGEAPLVSRRRGDRLQCSRIIHGGLELELERLQAGWQVRELGSP